MYWAACGAALFLGIDMSEIKLIRICQKVLAQAALIKANKPTIAQQIALEALQKNRPDQFLDDLAMQHVRLHYPEDTSDEDRSRIAAMYAHIARDFLYRAGIGQEPVVEHRPLSAATVSTQRINKPLRKNAAA